jgi:transcriptional regulator with XRE-family HTH domain
VTLEVILLYEVPTATIRTKLASFIRENGMTAQRFAIIAGINPGTISAILKQNRPISMSQLEHLEMGMELAAGTLFELYIQECFVDHTPHWRRLRPFLIRCAELGKLACIRQTTHKLLENVTYLPLVFELAEELDAAGKTKASGLLYESVAESEKYQHSERLAICHYKLFRIAIGKNMDLNLRAAIRFEPFQENLPDHLRLDGLLQLANVYYALRSWEKMEYYADELRMLSEVICQERKRSRKKTALPVLAERPLVVYYGQGYLLKSAALEHQQRYDEALHYIDAYSELGSFEELDEVGQREVAKFRLFAKANRFNIMLLSGNFSTLVDYAELLKAHPHEILPSTVVILRAANKHGRSIDAFLGQWVDNICIHHGDVTYYQETNYLSRYAEFCYQYALYQLRRERKVGLSSILQSLDINIQLGMKGKILDNICLFREYKHWASTEQHAAFERLLKEVSKDEESHTLVGISCLPK